MINETIVTDLRDGVLFLKLNRPNAMNAVDVAMSERMAEIAETLPALADGARVIVLHGAGGSFMAGGDIEMFKAHMPHVDRMLRPLIDGFHRFILALASAPQPVVCAVHGAAAGGGLSLAMSCDLVIAADNAKFAVAYRKLGASTDGGLTYVLPRLVGVRRAMELVLLSDPFGAEEALALGLVNRAVPADRLEAETIAIATKLAANSTIANAAMKELIRGSYDNDLPEQLAREQQLFVNISMGSDFSEGVDAFLGKRRPKFRAPGQAIGDEPTP